MRPRIDHKGKQYGHLTMLHEVRGNGASMGVTWLALCKCGNVREVDGTQASKGRLKSCGKCQYSRRTSSVNAKLADQPIENNVQVNKVMSKYILEARRRGIVYFLSTGDLLEMLVSPCSYCGDEPSPKGSIHTCVDRINILGGFTKTNTIPICRVCSHMKRGLNYVEFLDNVAKIAVHIARKRIAG